MAKLSLKDFSGGLSTKVKSHAIADNEAVEASNIDFSGFALRSSEGVDTTRKSGDNKDGNGHYHHKQEWITDSDAESFENFGDYVVKTYPNKDPMVTKVIPGEDNTEEPLGVPRKPGSKLATAVISEGDVGDKECLAFPILQIDEWPQENVVESTDTTFTSTRITLTGATPFKKNQDPKFEVGYQISIAGSDGNDGRYTITAVDSSFMYLDVKPNFKETGNQTSSIRIKTQGAIDDEGYTLEDVDTLANSDSEDMVHYASTLGKYVSYNKTQKQVTIYDTNGSGNDNPSATLTNTGSNERFYGDFFSTNDTDGASFVDVSNNVVPVDNVTFTTGDANGMTGITRKTNNTRMFASSYLASTTSTGTMTHATETTKGQYWLKKDKRYLIIDAIDNSAGYTLYKKNTETGNREEVTIPWTEVKMTLSAGTTALHNRTTYHVYNYYTTPELKNDQYLTLSNNDYSKVFEVGGNTSHSVTGTELTYRYQRKIRDVGKGPWNWKIGSDYRDYYKQTPTSSFSNNGKSITIGPFLTGEKHYNYGNYWGSSSSWSNFYPRAWSATSIWSSRSSTMPQQTTQHTYSGTVTDSKQARVLKYTPGSAGTVSTVHAASKIIGKLSISDSANDLATITNSNTNYNFQNGFQIGDQVTVSGSHWNNGTYVVNAVTSGDLQLKGKFSQETEVITLDSYVNHGDFNINFNEGFPNYYGVVRKEESKNILKGYSLSTSAHTSSWGSYEVPTGYVIYGEEVSSIPFFIVKSPTESAFTISRVRLTDTSSVKSYPIQKHNKFDVLNNRIVVSGQQADIVIYNFSGNVVHSRDGAGKSLGLNDSQKINRGWYDVTSQKVILELLDKSILFIKPDSKSPSQGVLRAPFNEFINYNSSNGTVYGATKSDAGKLSKIQKVRPFYFDEVKAGQQIEQQGGSSNSIGTVVKSLRKSDVDRFRYILVDFAGTGNAWHDPSDTDKLTWRFFLPGHTSGSPRYFDFKSTAQKDIVVFDEGENNIPQAGKENSNTQVTFYNNYDYTANTHITSYYYYVTQKNQLSIHTDHKLVAHKLKNGDPTTQTAYDSKMSTHGIGQTMFFIGAPNMYDSLGALLPFRYQIAFVDKNGREGPPCDITDEIDDVNDPNDSVQLTMNSQFFSTARHTSGLNNVEKVRIYRYGGNYSSFKFLAERDVSSVINNGLPYNLSVAPTNNAPGYTNKVRLQAISASTGDKVHAQIITEVESDAGLSILQDYAGSTIEISGFTNTATIGSASNVPVNNGKVRLVNVTRDNTTTPNRLIMRVQAHPDSNLIREISGTKYSIVGYNNPATPTFTHEDAASISVTVTEFGFRDRERNPPITALVPQYDASPPLVLDENGAIKSGAYFKNITNVGGIFFASNGSQVRFSHFNNPHSWPVIGYVEVDGEVNGVIEYFGEGLVFTNNSTYRIRGSHPEQMSIVKLPDNQGLPSSYRKTLTVVDGTVIWISNDGICMYDSGSIRVLSLNKFDEFPILNNPVGCAQDRIVYFFQQPDPDGVETREGIKMDLSYGDPRITKTSIESDHAVYVTELDQLFVNNTVDNTKSGTVGGGNRLPVVFKSKSFDFGDMNENKALMHLEADYVSLDVVKRATFEGGVKGSEAVREYLNTTDHGNLDLAESVIENFQLNQVYEDPRIEAELELGTITDSISSNAASSEYLIDIDSTALVVGMYVWGDRVQKGSKITEIVSGSRIKIDKPALTTGTDTLYFGDLPRISVFADESDTVLGTVFPFPGEGESVSTDLYLNNYEVFRTLAVKIEGVMELRELSVNAEPVSAFKQHTLFHSFDITYSGTVDLVLTIDGKDVYMRSFTSQDGVDEKRVYVPSSTFGQVPFFKNNSHLGRVNSLNFNSFSMRN